MDTKKTFVIIKPKNKTFLSTRNLTNDKLDTLYIGTFRILNVTNTTVELSLPDTKIFLKFYASLIKKIPPDTPLATTWNYSTKKNTKSNGYYKKKQGDQKAEFLIKWKNYDISEAT